ncbi:hypothetical protein SK128_027801 [Halocaridina rubra]|uniref:Uncharacterized protein n=1 Tax=Halocaridina rubra TaxID=373956 RepID=A0AAN8X5F7_HALRR
MGATVEALICPLPLLQNDAGRASVAPRFHQGGPEFRLRRYLVQILFTSSVCGVGEGCGILGEIDPVNSVSSISTPKYMINIE